MDAKLAKLRGRVEQNLWTEDSRKADSADSREMPLAVKKRNLRTSLRKDKYNLNLASYRFHLFSLNVLFALKVLQGNFRNLTTVK